MALPYRVSPYDVGIHRPGIRAFAPKDDEFSTSGGGDDDDDEDDEDEDEDDPKPKADEVDLSDLEDADADTLREHVKKARLALKKTNAESRDGRHSAKAARKKIAELEAELATRGKKKKSDDEDEDEVAEKVSAAEKKGKSIALRASAARALERAGLNLGDDEDSSIARALRLLDLDDLDVDENGRVDGLADAIAELKEDMPTLFAKPRKKRRINGDDEGKDAPKKSMSATERQVANLKKPKR